MKLSGEQMNKAIKWLNEHWKGDTKCMICQNNNWNISDIIFEFRAFSNGNLIVGGPVYPAIVVICTNCGLSLIFNAIHAGIITVTENNLKLGEEVDNVAN